MRLPPDARARFRRYRRDAGLADDKVSVESLFISLAASRLRREGLPLGQVHENPEDRLRVNIEFVRPEDFVPALAGTETRHVFIETIGRVSFCHYDPYAQLLSKVVRGFDRDMLDARSFLASGRVDAARFRDLVSEIPDAAYAKYPALSREAVREAVNDFLTRIEE